LPGLTLADLVRNRTMSPEIAGVLATAAAERRSLLMIAIPRMAGKSTTMEAALAYSPAGTRLHQLDTADGPELGIPEQGDGGYLVMSEISEAPFSTYLWGEPVRHAFSALERGFSLATALHAGSVDDAFSIITEANGVPDEDAARLDLAVYIRSLGDDWQNPERRVIAEVREVDTVANGQPRGRTLFLWNETDDRFEAPEPARTIGAEGSGLAAATAHFRAALGADS